MGVGEGPGCRCWTEVWNLCMMSKAVSVFSQPLTAAALRQALHLPRGWDLPVHHQALWRSEENEFDPCGAGALPHLRYAPEGLREGACAEEGFSMLRRSPKTLPRSLHVSPPPRRWGWPHSPPPTRRPLGGGGRLRRHGHGHWACSGRRGRENGGQPGP